MEIEVGDYVRTTDGEIHKVVKIKEDLNDMNYYIYENNMGDFSVCITKHSKNIIDLIEKGDFVNEELVVEKLEITCLKDKEYIRTKGMSIGEGYLAEDIETILTKEQYNQNCYVVEE